MLDATDAFDLTEFFAGHVTAYGMFEDRFGRVQRRFTVAMHGAFDGDGCFLLSEDFQYDDGETLERVWRFVPQTPGRLTATAPDVIGEVTCHASLDMIAMNYLHVIKMNGQPLVLRFEDRIHKLNPTSALSRTRVKKWGFKVGEVSIFFQRDAAANHAVLPDFANALRPARAAAA
jgi:hypothetical protein